MKVEKLAKENFQYLSLFLLPFGSHFELTVDSNYRIICPDEKIALKLWLYRQELYPLMNQATKLEVIGGQFYAMCYPQ